MKKKVKSKKTIGFGRVLKKKIAERVKRDEEKKNKECEFGKKFRERFPTLIDEILKVFDSAGGSVGFYENGICVSSPLIKRWAGSAFVAFVPITLSNIYRDGRTLTFDEFTNKDVTEKIASELSEYIGAV